MENAAIEEQVRETLETLGNLHRHFDLLVNQIRQNNGVPEELSVVEFSGMVQASNEMASAIDSLRFSLNTDRL